MSPKNKENSVDLYINIPFCAKKCAFCDELTYDSVELLKDYMAGLIDELKLRAKSKTPNVDVGYVGGGSPPLTLPFLIEFMKAAQEHLKFNLAEFTIEAMPGTFGIQEADRLKRLGFDRVALGLLSLDDQRLKELDRPYSSEQAVISYHILRQVGFRNIDIVLAIEKDDRLDLWQDTIEMVLSLNPEHISLYTGLGDGNFKECYLWIDEFLQLHGYEHYEYASFSRPEFRCQHKIHNLLLRSQLGIGLSAVNISNGIREQNYGNIDDYLDAVHAQELPVVVKEEMDVDELKFISGIRSFIGVEKKRFPARALKHYLKDGLLVQSGDRVYPTKLGYLFSDAIIEQVIS